MRLLDVNTYELIDFTLKRPIPRYGILSHTWGEEEVSFADLASPKREALKGWTKIENTCRLAREDEYDYVWIDTCCIDKSSSAELSEAINSMFVWYQQSAKCYVALTDVDGSDVGQLMASRWWTRGWTLQELLAPRHLLFYDASWNLVGSRQDRLHNISNFTGIPVEVLKGREDILSVCIAARMSWASERQTTRPEDEAYCLLGIFGVNMPLIYGEGQKAFQRLQYEIIRTTRDLTFLAQKSTKWGDLLARSPRAFRVYHGYRIPFARYDGEVAITNQGLKLQSARFDARPCSASQAGNHYRLCVALKQFSEFETIWDEAMYVCFERIGPKSYVRHTLCNMPEVSKTTTSCSQHDDTDVTLLFDVTE